MGGYEFSIQEQPEQQIDTPYRKIKTAIPAPDYADIKGQLDKYEARSMHDQLPIVWDRAEDFLVYDQKGNCWIDFTSTIFVANCGHSNPHVIAALRKQLDQSLIHTYTFPSRIRADFLKKLIAVTPPFCEKAFLLSSGTEATECALKLMRMRGRTIRPDKIGIISFQGNMHGRTMGAEMLRGDAASADWIGYSDPHIYHLPFPYPWNTIGESGDSDGAIRFQKDIENLQQTGGFDPDRICGFVIEPYQGWAGVLFPQEYIRALCEFAKAHDILVTFDEIQGGFGRTGKMFVYEHYGVEPDLLCLGKALSGGLPLSAVVGRKDILDLPEVGSMSSTHSANPLCCAAGLANIEEITTRGLVAESARKGAILHAALEEMKNKYPQLISWVLGKGLLAALLVTDPKTGKPDGALASRICEMAMRQGLLLVHTGRESIKIGPPLTIPDDALQEGISVLDECLSQVDS